MAQMLEELAWGEAVLPVVHDPAWEAEIRRRGGQVMQCDLRLTPSPWLRELALSVSTYRPAAMSERLIHIGAMVTAQENACRYCYGANRAFLKILGYSEEVIHRIERDMQVAQLDARDRAFVAFCRKLARSRPRPTRRDGEALVALGFTDQAVCEMAFVISMGCFYNRVSTFMACPPELGLERMAGSPLGRIVGWMLPLVQAWRRWRQPRPAAPPDARELARGPFGQVLAPLAGLPGARVVQQALEAALAAPGLAGITKVLMFAVIARTLDCGRCETLATQLLADAGLSPAEVEQALAQLRCERVPAAESSLLAWARGTVHYDTATVQRETQALLPVLGPRALLEAIGIAALANAVVRLAMLQE